MLSIIFVGCTIQTTPQVKEQTVPQIEEKNKSEKIKEKEVKKVSSEYKMFQTVDEKDAILLQDGKDKKHGAICGMDLVKFYKTSYGATYNGKEHQYCSLHCLAEHLGQGIELKNPKVVDVSTLKFVPVLEAYYVVGSSKKATMSKVSKYAFSSLQAAEIFKSKYGGEIMDFYGALEKAKEDFKYYK